MQAKTELFDKYNDQDIQKFTLTNDHGVSISVISLGATWNAFTFPDKDGKEGNVLLSMDSSAAYMKDQYFCQAIGRTAGRITNGTFSIKGKEYHVDQNEGTTTLHGGPHGFNSQVWDGSIEDNKIILKKHIDSSYDSFPGNIDVTITWTLSDDNVATVSYSAKSDADTLFNPTQHAYLNLGDTENVYGHSLTIDADNYLELNKDKTPTGKKVPVDDTPYDFRDSQNLKLGIDDMKAEVGHTYDEVYAINDHADDQPIAKLADPDSGRSVSIFSTRNALVVFTPDDLDGIKFERGAGVPHMGVALEAQNLPDTPNHEGFGSVLLPAGEEKTYSISYKAQF
ncbi:galactose mutarotase [Lentilactobacillus parafarraginis]|jgi:aldose 1-epimerase|uniref:Maltose epimerase n=2 Tax=Lentilactobacillus parafarraginis TaxID=390842 RepID=A0A0R1YRG8_9LACO|nr:aldose epimerase family protein [Lentilactobacillus parafarraginis]KRM44719.1 aldose 1-epimerase [Lentilactobacillus parafarraginis DSM 18390 = JCM 14109]TLQ19879.1 galactose mutarotase [Lentilactobacillus parafarraginis]